MVITPRKNRMLRTTAVLCLSLLILIPHVASTNVAKAETVPGVFTFTGGVQTYVVPPDVRALAVTMVGAGELSVVDAPVSGAFTLPPYVGGRGGQASGVVPVTPGETLSVYVGGRGKGNSGDFYPYVFGVAGAPGFNGGGTGGGGPAGPIYAPNVGSGGHGASDIRRGTAKLLVAGGAGGHGSSANLYRAPGGDGCAPGPLGDGKAGAFGAGSGPERGRGATPTAAGVGGSGTYPGWSGTSGQGGNGRMGFTGGGGGGGGYFGGGGGGGLQYSGGVVDPLGIVGGNPVGPSAGGGGGGSCYAAPGVQNPVFVPGVNAGDGFVQITPVDTSDVEEAVSEVEGVVREVEGLIRDPIPEYHSDACTGGTVVADGYAGSTYVKLRSDQPNSQLTRVCFRADGSEVHLGGRIEIVDSGSPGTPTIENDNACASTPVLLGEVGDPNDPPTHVPYEVSVDVNPNEVWVCVKVDDLVRRVIVPVAGAPSVSYLPDNDLAHAAGAEPPTNTLLPSSACQNNGGQALVNSDLGEGHVSLYLWEESTKEHVCVRAEGPTSAGGRLSIDTTGSPGVVPEVQTFTDQASQCNLNVITNVEPVSFSVRRSSATNPAWVCVVVEDIQEQVRIGASTGAQTIVTFIPDP